MSLLQVKDLSISFSGYSKFFSKTETPVISNLNLEVNPKEVVAIIGASGSGKSLLAHAILGILPQNAKCGGEITYKGESLTPKRIKELRGKSIVLVPQSVAYLDPLMKIGSQVTKGANNSEISANLSEIFRSYHLHDDVKNSYPFELSGGMTRRILISTAMIESPDLVIADEPTPGLNLELAERVMSHFRELADMGAGVIVITHDLELAIKTADKIVVLYSGTAVEQALANDFNDVTKLRHPYSKALFNAMPKNGFKSILGTQPYANNLEGCAFADRCDKFTEECLSTVPLINLRDGFVKCIHAE